MMLWPGTGNGLCLVQNVAQGDLPLIKLIEAFSPLHNLHQMVRLRPAPIGYVVRGQSLVLVQIKQSPPV